MQDLDGDDNQQQEHQDEEVYHENGEIIDQDLAQQAKEVQSYIDPTKYPY
jgi:hypothetical protein